MPYSGMHTWADGGRRVGPVGHVDDDAVLVGVEGDIDEGGGRRRLPHSDD